jgi:ribosomal protein S18 acetylase RimI-like enzyme
MLTVTTVPADPSHANHEHTRALFREYGEFLSRTQACGGTFNFERFSEEIRTLPGCYAHRGGDVLLARLDASPVAVVAYRQASPDEPRTCEIKRLFVRESARRQGLARALLSEVMQRAATQGFTRAILDSDASIMPAAIALYQSLGFTEFGERNGTIAFFERSLP